MLGSQNYVAKVTFVARKRNSYSAKFVIKRFTVA
jgi:hypothetical protein